ncbi:MAG: hydrogenase maturation nickel metallochaperone HypA [Chloroflexi bacterium]|nr:hydrogenase maturation nickel metallochaperone HypA [Chloroflexota bacterium]
MHELGIAQQMLKIALDHAGANKTEQITAFNIEMSDMADENPESLTLCLENLARNTIAQDARVNIARVPARMSCLDCGNEYDSATSPGACPHCHSTLIRPLEGDEFRLISIDVA